jgi:hypothetical protein
MIPPVITALPEIPIAAALIVLATERFAPTATFAVIETSCPKIELVPAPITAIPFSTLNLVLAICSYFT